jgi:hypothetical protein
VASRVCSCSVESPRLTTGEKKDLAALICALSSIHLLDRRAATNVTDVGQGANASFYKRLALCVMPFAFNDSDSKRLPLMFPFDRPFLA